jgi:serine/threonine protein kinase
MLPVSCHGGLSPDSIVITAKGHAKIPAFELASRGGFEPDAGAVRLRDYDAPEEARGQAADERSDIYSVGAVLYEMITTRRPMHKGAAGAKRVELSRAGRAGRHRVAGSGTESRLALSERGRPVGGAAGGCGHPGRQRRGPATKAKNNLRHPRALLVCS